MVHMVSRRAVSCGARHGCTKFHGKKTVGSSVEDENMYDKDKAAAHKLPVSRVRADLTLMVPEQRRLLKSCQGKCASCAALTGLPRSRRIALYCFRMTRAKSFFSFIPFVGIRIASGNSIQPLHTEGADNTAIFMRHLNMFPTHVFSDTDPPAIEIHLRSNPTSRLSSY